MADNEYDVVIVGAGITGAIVAKTLGDGGVRKILILEAGNGTGADPDGYRSYVDHYFQQTVKVPNSAYPYNANAPSVDLKELFTPPSPDRPHYLVQLGPTPFLSDYERAKGGTTLHWLGTCLRMLPSDFRMQSRYGRGVDWPISYDDLRPYYERAEREIGVSGDVADQIYPNMGDQYFSEGYDYPMEKIPQSYLDQQLAAQLNGFRVPVAGQEEEVELLVESTPQGRNSTPRPGYKPVGMVGEPETGQRCEGNSSCVPICPVQAKYNALKTLNAVKRDVNLEVRTRSVASEILVNRETGQINGIKYKRYECDTSPNHTTETVTGKRYVLASNAVEVAKLLLASDAASTSDQVGRNLMDHLCLLTWARMPNNIGAFRGPGSTSGIPAFRDGDFRSQHGAFRVEIGNWGWNWPAGAPVADVNNYVGGKDYQEEQIFGTALKKALAEDIPRQFRIAWEIEQTPDPENRITIDPQYLDRLGNYRPVANYHITDYDRAGVAAASDINERLFDRLGIKNESQYRDSDPGYFTYKGTGYSVNGAGHVVGTHRMGDDPGTSVVNTRQQCWDHDNLYLVGCGNMPTLGTSNPTLTAAALAIWAGENILEDLNGGKV